MQARGIYDGKSCLIQFCQWNLEFRFNMYLSGARKRTVNIKAALDWGQFFLSILPHITYGHLWFR